MKHLVAKCPPGAVHTLDGLALWDRDSNQVKPYCFNDEVSWADTVGSGPNGSLYFVSNHLHLFVDNDMNFDNPAVPNFRIGKLETGRKPYTAP